MKHSSQFFLKRDGDGEDEYRASVETEGSSDQAIEQEGKAWIAKATRPRSAKRCNVLNYPKECVSN